MPNTASTITNTLPTMPFHFIPQAAPHLARQILFANREISKVDIDTARNTALEKLTNQSNDHFPRSDNTTKPQVDNFLNPQDKAHSSDAFEALKKEYIKLVNEPLGDRSITSYVESVQAITQNINEKFDTFLKKEKEAFHNAYKTDYSDEAKEKRKELWEMYAKNLRVNMQAPLEKFTKNIDDLVPQALTYYVNQLGKKTDPLNPFAKSIEEGNKEKLERKLQYTDSKGKPIIITKDKKTGQPSEIRIDPMSSLFGSSGDIGDAYAILAAYHGKDIPIRVVVPVFEDDNIYTEMKDFIALLIFLIFAQIYKHMEKNHYLKEAKQAAMGKGISLDNISLVDTRGNPLVFSEKDKADVRRKLQELDRNHLVQPGTNPAEKNPEEESQNKQPSPKPTPV